MTSVFISYRRRPSAMLAQLIARELQARGIQPFMDTRQTDGGGPFPARLLRAIQDQDVFVCLVADSTFDSDWVRREIEHAHTLNKTMIPVFQESWNNLIPKPAPPDEHVRALLQYDGVHVLDERNVYVDNAMDDLAAMIRRSELPRARRKARSVWGAGAVIAVVVIAAVILVLSLLDGDGGNGQKTPATTAAALADADTGSPTIEPSATDTPTETPSPTQTPPLTPTPGPLQAAQTPVSRNDQWEPFVQDAGGVEMVLVPAGCFEMGGTQYDNEKPPHEVCFEEPFWIDRTEVTNAQFAAFGGQVARDSYFSGDERPREQITWTEAQAFCELRGARLPTEAEWEYAARGPDGLVYPWGNEWTPDNVVWGGNSNGQTAEVGSKPEGRSWVGALDLSGNVWEWVADWYGAYPEGRQVNPTGPAIGEARVVRGGSWYGTNTAGGFRAADRVDWDPYYGSFNWGFRCARSFR